MKTKIKWIGMLVLFALLFSCTDDTPGQGGQEEDEGKGLIALYLRPGNLSKATNAGDAGVNDTFAQENAIKNIRVILYNLSGKAAYIRDYDPTDASQWMSNTFPVYKTKPFEVKKADYSLAVLINYKNNASDNYDMDMDYRTKDIGHTINVLTDALDFSGVPFARNVMARTFTGIAQSSPGLISSSDWDNNSAFFMSNADGLVEITKSNIYPTEAEASNHPVTVRVERAVSKIALFKSADFKGPEEALTIEGDIQWRIDVTNQYVRPIREITYTAPYSSSRQFGEIEDINADRHDRYAVDPNYDGISNERYLYHKLPLPPGIADPNDIFYRIDQENDLNLTVTDYIDENTSPELLGVEYIPENTMVREEQYEDVTSSLIIKVVMSQNSNYSYFIYKNIIYSEYELRDYLVNFGYREEFADLNPYRWELSQVFFPDGTLTTESKSVRGLNYYADGTHYFRIPIRHFTNTQSPEYQIGYGRYGIVRNNYYKLILNGITGCGSSVVPEPEGPDDKDKKLMITPVIMLWYFRTNGTSVGEPGDYWDIIRIPEI